MVVVGLWFVASSLRLTVENRVWCCAVPTRFLSRSLRAVVLRVRKTNAYGATARSIFGARGTGRNGWVLV